LQNGRDTDQYHEQLEQLYRRSLANLSIAQKQMAPMTPIIKTPIKAESIATQLCRESPADSYNARLWSGEVQHSLASPISPRAEGGSSKPVKIAG
jgi:hypothetical protein